MRVRLTQGGDGTKAWVSNKYTLILLMIICLKTKLNRYLWVWHLPHQFKDKKKTLRGFQVNGQFYKSKEIESQSSNGSKSI